MKTLPFNCTLISSFYFIYSAFEPSYLWSNHSSEASESIISFHHPTFQPGEEHTPLKGEGTSSEHVKPRRPVGTFLGFFHSVLSFFAIVFSWINAKVRRSGVASGEAATEMVS